MEVNLVTESFKFMILGMSVVFLFLILMIFVLKLLTAIIQRYFAKPITPTSTAPSALVSTKESNQVADDQAVIAAITAAISEFRK